MSFGCKTAALSFFPIFAIFRPFLTIYNQAVEIFHMAVNIRLKYGCFERNSGNV